MKKPPELGGLVGHDGAEGDWAGGWAARVAFCGWCGESYGLRRGIAVGAILAFKLDWGGWLGGILAEIGLVWKA